MQSSLFREFILQPPPQPDTHNINPNHSNSLSQTNPSSPPHSENQDNNDSNDNTITFMISLNILIECITIFGTPVTSNSSLNFIGNMNHSSGTYTGGAGIAGTFKSAKTSARLSVSQDCSELLIRLRPFFILFFFILSGF